jgi:hypothetical protein
MNKGSVKLATSISRLTSPTWESRSPRCCVIWKTVETVGKINRALVPRLKPGENEMLNSNCRHCEVHGLQSHRFLAVRAAAEPDYTSGTKE